MGDDIDRSDELREIWADDGADLLDELQGALTRYVVFPDEHASIASALWIAATHALVAFEFAPRMVVTSPQKRCGKTRLLDVIAYTCHRPLATVDATVAAIFRSLGGEHPPTLIIDEADAIFGSKKAAENNEDLRKLLNAGHQRGRPALRCVGPLQVPTEFPVFAMAALVGIGAMPDTITDRGINFAMRRRTRGEKVSQFRSRRDGPILERLRDKLAVWAAEHVDELTDAVPDMPVEDRAADTWEPLIAIADAAGGHWPVTARAACRALVDAADEAGEDSSLPIKLLVDVRQIFTDKAASFLSSADLVTELRRIEESPWGEFELTSRKLAHRLKAFGVKPGFNTDKTVRGYRIKDLADAFARYIRPEASDRPGAQVNDGFSPDGSKPPDGSIRPDENIRPEETAGQTLFADDWTLPDDSPPGNGHHSGGFTPPPGPGRCDECGFHVPTQGHRDDCPQTPARRGPVI